MVAAPLAIGASSSVEASQSAGRAGTARSSVRAYGASKCHGRVAPLQINAGARAARRAARRPVLRHLPLRHPPGARRVELAAATTRCVPGHEIIGRVQRGRQRGDEVQGRRHRRASAAWSTRAARATPAASDREQNCEKGATFTYNGTEDGPADATYGGYSDADRRHRAVRACASRRAWTSRRRRRCCARASRRSRRCSTGSCKPGQRVGVVGLGGLGHMAVKLAALDGRRGHGVHDLARQGGGREAARRDGGRPVDRRGRDEAARRTRSTCSSPPSRTAYPMQPFVDAAASRTARWSTSARWSELTGSPAFALIYGGKSLAGSMIGGIAETQEMIDYCASPEHQGRHRARSDPRRSTRRSSAS